MFKLLQRFPKNAGMRSKISRQDLEYVSYVMLTVRKHTICSACNNTFVDPVLTICKHTFCQKCLDRLISDSHKCPKCHAVLVSRESSDEDKNILRETVEFVDACVADIEKRSKCKVEELSSKFIEKDQEIHRLWEIQAAELRARKLKAAREQKNSKVSFVTNIIDTLQPKSRYSSRVTASSPMSDVNSMSVFEKQMSEFDLRNKKICDWLNCRYNIFDVDADVITISEPQDSEKQSTISSSSMNVLSVSQCKPSHSNEMSPETVTSNNTSLLNKKNQLQKTESLECVITKGPSKRTPRKSETILDNTVIELADSESVDDGERFIINMIEEDYLNKIEKEFSDGNKSKSGWDPARKIKKALRKKKSKMKQLNVSTESCSKEPETKSMKRKSDDMNTSEKDSAILVCKLDNFESYVANSLDKVGIRSQSPPKRLKKQKVEEGSEPSVSKVGNTLRRSRRIRQQITKNASKISAKRKKINDTESEDSSKSIRRPSRSVKRDKSVLDDSNIKTPKYTSTPRQTSVIEKMETRLSESDNIRENEPYKGTPRKASEVEINESALRSKAEISPSIMHEDTKTQQKREPACNTELVDILNKSPALDSLISFTQSTIRCQMHERTPPEKTEITKLISPRKIFSNEIEESIEALLNYETIRLKEIMSTLKTGISEINNIVCNIGLDQSIPKRDALLFVQRMIPVLEKTYYISTEIKSGCNEFKAATVPPDSSLTDAVNIKKRNIDVSTQTVVNSKDVEVQAKAQTGRLNAYTQTVIDSRSAEVQTEKETKIPKFSVSTQTSIETHKMKVENDKSSNKSRSPVPQNVLKEVKNFDLNSKKNVVRKSAKKLFENDKRKFKRIVEPRDSSSDSDEVCEIEAKDEPGVVVVMNKQVDNSQILSGGDSINYEEYLSNLIAKYNEDLGLAKQTNKINTSDKENVPTEINVQMQALEEEFKGVSGTIKNINHINKTGDRVVREISLSPDNDIFEFQADELARKLEQEGGTHLNEVIAASVFEKSFQETENCALLDTEMENTNPPLSNILSEKTKNSESLMESALLALEKQIDELNQQGLLTPKCNFSLVQNKSSLAKQSSSSTDEDIVEQTPHKNRSILKTAAEIHCEPSLLLGEIFTPPPEFQDAEKISDNIINGSDEANKTEQMSLTPSLDIISCTEKFIGKAMKPPDTFLEKRLNKFDKKENETSVSANVNVLKNKKFELASKSFDYHDLVHKTTTFEEGMSSRPDKVSCISESNPCLNNEMPEKPKIQLNISQPRSQSNLNPIVLAQKLKFSPLTIIQSKQPKLNRSITQKQQSILSFMQTQTKTEAPDCSKVKIENVCIACTRLDKVQTATVMAMVAQFKVQFSKEFTPQVTHMIVTSDERNRVCDHTMKYVMAVAAGLWVVSGSWIEESMKQGYIVSEVPYEVTDIGGHPGPFLSRTTRLQNPLFREFVVFCLGPFVATNKTDVENVVKLLGGKTVNSLLELQMVHKNSSCVCLIIMEPNGTQTFVQYHEYLQKLDILTVDIEWLSRSVGQYRLLSLRPFALCSEERIQELGYPEALTATISEDSSQFPADVTIT